MSRLLFFLGKSTKAIPVGNHILKKILNIIRKTIGKYTSFSLMGSLSRTYSIKIESSYKEYGKLFTKLRLLSKEYASISGLRIKPEILEQTG